MIMRKIALLTFCILLAACQSGNSQTNAHPNTSDAELKGLSKAYFASGCFWCVEAVFQSVEGVKEAISGYSGGDKKNPTYKEVSYGLTDHAEAVEVYYDPAVVSYETLLKVFFGSQDPTQVDRQGPDRGKQYRSAVFYTSEKEKELAEAYIKQLESGEYKPGEIATEVTAFKSFWPAEDYHQEYESNHPENPYVQSVSIPRLNRFKAKYPDLLKKDAH